MCLTMSRLCCTTWVCSTRRCSPGASRVAIKMGSAAFLAPEAWMVPWSGRPPSMTILFMSTSPFVARAQARAPDHANSSGYHSAPGQRERREDPVVWRQSTSGLARCTRSPRPVSVGVKTVCPASRSIFDTRTQHQPPCHAPCTSRYVAMSVSLRGDLSIMGQNEGAGKSQPGLRSFGGGQD